MGRPPRSNFIDIAAHGLMLLDSVAGVSVRAWPPQMGWINAAGLINYGSAFRFAHAGYLLRCMSPLMALRDTHRCHELASAFRAKRKRRDAWIRLPRLRMTHLGSQSALPTG